MTVSPEQQETATGIRGGTAMEREPTETLMKALGTTRERVVGKRRKGRGGAGMQCEKEGWRVM